MSFASRGRKAIAITAAALIGLTVYATPALAATATPSGDLQSFTTTASVSQILLPVDSTSVTFTDTITCATQQATYGFWYNFISGYGSQIVTINDDLAGVSSLTNGGKTATATKTYNLTLPGEYSANSYGPSACGEPWNVPDVGGYYESTAATVDVYDTPSFYNSAFDAVKVGDYVNWDASAYGFGVAYTVTAGTLPDGLSLDPTYGSITGVPTTEGAYDFTVTGINPAGTDTQRYTGTVSPKPAITLTADKSSISSGESVTFTTNADGGAHAAFFVDGQFYGDGSVSDTPNPFEWSMFGCGTDVIGTYRIYDEPFGEVSQPDFTTPYLASVDVTFVGDGSNTACFQGNSGGSGGALISVDKTTLSGPGDSATLTLNANPETQAFCVTIDSVTLGCGPFYTNTLPISWDTILSSFFGQYDPTVDHSFTFSVYNQSDLDLVNSPYLPNQGASSLDSVTITTLGYTPTAPGDVTGINSDQVTETSAHIGWNAVDGATSYNVYVNGVLVGTTESLGYDLTGLTEDTEYTVSIEAVNGGGSSTPTDSTLTTQAATPNTPAAPGAVSGITANPVTNNSAHITWGAVTGATSYKVYVNGVLVSTTSNLFYDLSALNANSGYTVSIVAVNDGGSSDPTVYNLMTMAASNGGSTVVKGKTVSVSFGSDSAVLTASAKKALRALVAVAKAKGLNKIVVTGYALKVAGRSATSRAAIAKARALAAARYLKSLNASLIVSIATKANANVGRLASVVLAGKTLQG